MQLGSTDYVSNDNKKNLNLRPPIINSLHFITVLSLRHLPFVGIIPMTVHWNLSQNFDNKLFIRHVPGWWYTVKLQRGDSVIHIDFQPFVVLIFHNFAKYRFYSWLIPFCQLLSSSFRRCLWRSG